MMGYAGYVWECECGHTEYGNNASEECKKCGRINSFVKLPEEIIDEREQDNIEKLENGS